MKIFQDLWTVKSSSTYPHPLKSDVRTVTSRLFFPACLKHTVSKFKILDDLLSISHRNSPTLKSAPPQILAHDLFLFLLPGTSGSNLKRWKGDTNLHGLFPRSGNDALVGAAGRKQRLSARFWLVHVTPVPSCACAHGIFNARACSRVYDNGAWQTAFHAGFLSLGHIKRTRVNFVYTWLFAC